MALTSSGVNVLVNCSVSEAKLFGGDFSTAATIAGFRGGRHRYALLRSRPAAADLVRRFVGGGLLRSAVGRLRGVGRAVYYRAPLTLPTDDPRPDVVLSIVVYPWFVGRRRAPVVWYSQGLMDPAFYVRWGGGATWEEYRDLYCDLARNADVVVVATAAGRTRLEAAVGQGSVRASVAPIPCEMRAVESIAQKGAYVPRVVFVGSDWRRKGLGELLPALEVVRRNGVEAEVDIVTSGDCALQSGFPATPYRRWWSGLRRKEVEALYRRAWVCAIPTHADTYNLALVEAMSQGCAVVTTEIDSLEEVAPPGRVGYSVPIGDVEALSDRLGGLLASEDRVREFGGKARDLYLERNFVPAAMARLESAIGAFRGPAVGTGAG